MPVDKTSLMHLAWITARAEQLWKPGGKPDLSSALRHAWNSEKMRQRYLEERATNPPAHAELRAEINDIENKDRLSPCDVERLQELNREMLR